jgi:hypothetical protein
VGLHHVITSLKEAGYINPSTNDMRVVELPTLNDENGGALAQALLEGESVRTDDIASASQCIAAEANGVPYYIHQIVDDLASKNLTADESTVRNIVKERISDPQDSWELGHFFERLNQYYRSDDLPTVNALFDAVAARAEGLGTTELIELVAAQTNTSSDDAVRRLLLLLKRDHYFIQDGEARYHFKLHLVARAWIARRA